MRKRHSLCFTAFAKPKPQNWVLEREVTGDPAWQAPVKAFESVNAGVVRFYERSVERCPKFRTVRRTELGFILELR